MSQNEADLRLRMSVIFVHEDNYSYIPDVVYLRYYHDSIEFGTISSASQKDIVQIVGNGGGYNLLLDHQTRWEASKGGRMKEIAHLVPM